MVVKLGYHGGFQREHGNKRRRQVNGARRRHGRALALAVPDNIYYRHNGNIEGVNRHNVDEGTRVIKAVVVPERQYYYARKRHIHHYQD